VAQEYFLPQGAGYPSYATAFTSKLTPNEAVLVVSTKILKFELKQAFNAICKLKRH